ncbi:unnamed protein product [Parnassius apollo]|uniref:(apollo) hypothetical protein n=1 Tax=Parnassius apollo TaxID=110799 RepID=A0A8S3XG09_PARAO|nr:unnamed protein product [Parnassius apollo]
MPLVPVDAYHPPLEISVSTNTRLRRQSDSAGSATPEINTFVGWNFNKADFLTLYSLIAAVDWTSLYELDLEMSLEYFYKIMNSAIDDCVPKKKRSRVNSRYIYPEWYTVEIIRDIRFKAFLHKRYKASGSKTDYEAFAQCRTKVKKMIGLAQEKYQQRVQNQMLKDPKSFWKHY